MMANTTMCAAVAAARTRPHASSVAFALPPWRSPRTEPACAPPPLRRQVMKMIEENRKKNEAKRAAQSARNAEIIAAFEQRQAGGQ